MATGEETQAVMGSARLYRAADFASLRKEGRTPVQLEWSDITLTVPDGSGGSKVVLQQLSGVARPGTCTAIMGASGAGKTSLLNVLAARIADGRAGCTVKGVTKLNGTEAAPTSYAKRVAYVMQDDALMGTSTVREALTFSARLRLASSIPLAEKLQLVESMIKMLGLESCADTLIGNELIQGVSGGERKRTAIGIELITSPDIIFLDEPTSGLDSYAAFNVISLLKELSHTGCTVLTTIHQPSSEVFFLFDNLTLLLPGGRLIYDDSASGLTKHLEHHGHVCPANYNPADYVMFLMQTKKKEMGVLADAWSHASSGSIKLGFDKPVAAPAGAAPAGHTGSASCMEQMACLAGREFHNVVRDKATMGARFGLTIGLGLVTGGIFWQVGDQEEKTYDLQSHFGALFQIGIGAMFGSAQPLILAFPAERPVFMREHATGSYSGVAYFLSKLLIELPLTAITSCILTTSGYLMAGLNGNFLVTWAGFYILGLVSAGTALLIGCLVSNIKTAMEATPAVFVPQMLFAGFFIKMEQIPVFLRWLQYLCGLKWSMNLLLVNEFGWDRCTAATKPSCERVLEANDVDEDDWPLYLLVLFGAFVFFRACALVALVQKARNFY